MNVKQTILEEHQTLERVKELEVRLGHIGVAMKLADITSKYDFTKQERGLIDGLLVSSEILKRVLDGADPQEAIANVFEPLEKNFDEDKD
ncbi:hypothetical protein [Streptococcus sp.]